MSLPTPIDTPTASTPKEDSKPVVEESQQANPAATKDDAEDEAEEDDEEGPIDIAECMAAGTRYFALKQYSQAAEQVSFAIEAINEKHGEMSRESAEALMLYGKALLHNAIAQSAVLGGGNAKAEQTEEAVQQAVAGPSSNNVAASWKFSFGGDAEDDEEEEEEEDGGEEDGPAAVDRDEELEGAYAAFDMVRAIWSKEDGKDAQIKVAEALRMCGEVERESEKFDLAIKEYESALSILNHVLAPTNRTLSELHMLIALAYDMIPDSVPKAVHHAEQSKAVLELRLADLEKNENKGDKTEREIVDIKELIGELEEKIEDLKFVPEEAPKTEAEKHIDELLKTSGFADAIKSGQVNNLNSLVKKKKPTSSAPVAPVIEEEILPQDGGESSTADVAPKRKAEETEEEAETKKTKVEA